MLKNVTNLFNDFIDLIYPAYCLGCRTNLLKHENYICTKCLYDLSKTNFHDECDNKVDKLFWGKTKIEAATAYCFFNKESIIQQLIHNLKYKGKKEVGLVLGKHLGADLLSSQRFKDIGLIIPVPLHPKRETKRGYNQSEWISIGISETMKKEYDTKSVLRNIYNETQTRKNREQRWANVESIFKIEKPENLNQKHILLIDDVITTGSTLEACAKTILENTTAKVSIASIAVAVN